MMRTGLKHWWDMRANRRFRQHLHRRFIAEAGDTAGPLTAQDLRLWDRLQKSLKPMPHTTSHARRIPHLIHFLFGGSLALAILSLVTIAPRVLNPGPPWDGIKSSEHRDTFAALDDFKIARVLGPHNLSPLADGARVAKGDQVIFSARSKPDVSGQPLADQGTLWHIHIPEPPRVLVDGHELATDNTVLKGPEGYYAYTLTQSGRHIFTMEASGPAAIDQPAIKAGEKGSVHALSIIVEVR